MYKKILIQSMKKPNTKKLDSGEVLILLDRAFSAMNNFTEGLSIIYVSK